MRQINLISLCNICKNKALENNYLEFSKIKIKPEEISDFNRLITELQKHIINKYIFDDYFVGFSIPQIGKEFDLLRFGEEFIVNIEVKKQAKEEKISEQLLKNQYYLSFLGKKVFKFTYIASENKLYTLNEDNQLIEKDFPYLISILENQKTIKVDNVDNLFNPSDYLVSPFNSTEKFIEGQYFLTNRQQEIKNNILKIIVNNTNEFVSIKGSAGTGKTLLIYDIAKEFIKRKEKILIIHCGILNNGQLKLIRENEWNIIPIKNILQIELHQYSLIILDECQRIYPSQLEKIIMHVKTNQKNIVFSYDSKQYLRDWENKNNIEKIIEESNHSKKFELNTKIRTNKEIAHFIKCLFKKNEKIEPYNCSNVILNYFENNDEALTYISFLRDYSWKHINYTPQNNMTFPYHLYNSAEEKDNSHKVIGQEFDNVIVVINSSFCYSNDNLSVKKFTIKARGTEVEPYYNPVKMLYQNITRVRKKLNVIIVNNPEIFERCVQILNGKH